MPDVFEAAGVERPKGAARLRIFDVADQEPFRSAMEPQTGPASTLLTGGYTGPSQVDPYKARQEETTRREGLARYEAQKAYDRKHAEGQHLDLYRRASSLWQETAKEGGQQVDRDKAAIEFARNFPFEQSKTAEGIARLQKYVTGQEEIRARIGAEHPVAAGVARVTLGLAEGVVPGFDPSADLGMGGKAALDVSRRSGNTALDIAEGLARGTGAVSTLGVLPGQGLLAQTAKGAAYGALADPEDPARGATHMAALMGLGAGAGKVLEPVIPGAGALPRAARGAVAFPAAGTVLRAATGQETTGAKAVEEAILGAGTGAMHKPSAPRRLAVERAAEPVSVNAAEAATRPQEGRTEAAPPPTAPPEPVAVPTAPERTGADPSAPQRVRVANVRADPARFQFKADVDAETGAGKQFEGVGRYDPIKADNLLMWEDGAGQRWVADGHHRLDLARRSGAEEVSAFVLRESDGVTAEQARGIAALRNIANGKGTALDAAKVMRDLGWTEQKFREEGVPTNNAMVRDAVGLSDLDPAVFSMVVNGEVPQHYASVIGRELRGDPGRQMEAAREVNYADNVEEAASIVRQIRNASTVVEKQTGLFGEEVMARSNRAERAKVEVAVKRLLGSDKRLFSMLANRAEQAQRVEGTKVNVEGSRAQAQTADEIMYAMNLLADKGGAVSEALNEAAGRVAAGETSVAGAAKQAVGRLAGIDWRTDSQRDPAGAGDGAAGSTGSLFRSGLPLEDVAAAAKTLGRGVGTGVQAIKEATTQFPRLTRENPEASLAASRSASSSVIAKEQAKAAYEENVRRHKLDPDEFGAALTEDNLRGTFDQYADRSKALRDEAAKAREQGQSDRAAALEKESRDFRDRALNLAEITLVGETGSPFPTEAAYQAYLARPEVKAAAESHNAWWQANKEPLFQARQKPLKRSPQLEMEFTEPDTRGRQLGARINLLSVQAAERAASLESGQVEPGVGASSSAKPLKNARVTRSPFSNRVMGSRAGYVTDYREIVAHSMNREVQGGNQRILVDELLGNGDAVLDRAGMASRLTIRGEPVVEVKSIRSAENPGQTLYVRESLANEVAGAFKVIPERRIPFISRGLDFVNRQSLKALADNFINMARGLTVPLTRPLSGGTTREIIANLGAWPVQLVRSYGRLIGNLREYAGRQKDVARLADLGAWRQYAESAPFSPNRAVAALQALSPFRWVNAIGKRIDQAARLSMDQAYTSLVKKGKAPNTATGRRDFVNQMGNYVRAAQGAFVRTMVETGIGPFTTAKATRWANRVRAATLDPGHGTAPGGGRALAAVEMFTKMTGAFTTYILANMATTQTPFGRQGVPFGQIDTGQTDEKGRPISVPFFDLVGLGDVLRMVGAQAYITAKRRGLADGASADAAGEQALGQILSFASSPGINALSTIATGGPIQGPDVAAKARPEDSQMAANVKAAAVEVNPLVRLFLMSAKDALPEGVTRGLDLDQREGKDLSSELGTQFSYFAPRPGLSDEQVRTLPGRVQGRRLNEYVDDLKRRILLVPVPKRREWLNHQIQGLDAKERRRALTEVIRSVRYKKERMEEEVAAR